MSNFSNPRGSETKTVYRVTCPDGAVRHGVWFTTLDEVEEWAEWAHACTAGHYVWTHSSDPAVTSDPRMMEAGSVVR